METINDQIIASEIKGALSDNIRSAGLNVRKIGNLDRVSFLASPEICITLCPLYGQGPLEESTLIAPPERMEESRVYNKWQSAMSLVETFKNGLSQFMITPRVVFTFADLGVISRTQDERTNELLAYSEQLYTNAARDRLGIMGVEFDFLKYSDLRSDFPRFIAPGGNMDGLFRSKKDISEKMDAMIGRLNQSGIEFADNFDRKTIEKMMTSLGVKVTEGLLAQYGTFDAITTRDGKINAFFERSGLLLQVTDLFPHRDRPRIDILC